MSFSKINYKDNETIITADNLNDIQDAILEGYQPDGTIEYADFAESTKLALLNLIYPIGSIYMSVDDISPANQFGGTWEQIKDRFILAAGSTYTAGAVGGEAAVTLTTNEIPSHSHVINYAFDEDTAHPVGVKVSNYCTQTTKTTSGGNKLFTGTLTYQSASTSVPIYLVTTGPTGDGAAHNNMPPYLVAYMWKRIA